MSEWAESAKSELSREEISRRLGRCDLEVPGEVWGEEGDDAGPCN